MGFKYGDNDLASRKLKNFGINRQFYECPVEINPGDVIRKEMAFLFNIDWRPFRDTITQIMVNWPDYIFTLEVIDIASEERISVTIPGRYP